MSEKAILFKLPPQNAPPADALAPLPAEALTETGDVISKALLFSLGRNYLDAPVFANQSMRLVEGDPPQAPDIAFLRLEQVGQLVDEDLGEIMNALETTLAASHDPNYGLVFIISSDGLRNTIYIGVRARGYGAQPRLFAEQFGQFLCSNWRGTRVQLVSDYNEIAKKVHLPLSGYRYVRSLTGVPSLKNDEKEEKSMLQSLDQLMRGLRGRPYMYMVLAEPMPEAAVGDIIHACRSLSGQVHAFVRATVNQGKGESSQESTSASESETTSDGSSSSKNTSTSKTAQKGALGSFMDNARGANKALKGVGVAGVGAMAVSLSAGPMLLSNMLGLFGQLMPSSNTSSTESLSSSESENVSRTRGTTQTDGTTSSESLSASREYLNKHAEACEELIDKTIERFELARGQGCWNVGVYLLSDQAETAAQGQAQLKALFSGARSAVEPVRVHDLKPVWDGAQVYLDAFAQPPLRLSAPEGNEAIHHPLGANFDGLTTLLNTEELSLLANLPLREMPGMPVQPTASFSLNPPQAGADRLSLGNLLDGGEEVKDLSYGVDIDGLTRHVFVTGITGSGKSNTCRRLLEELLERDKNFMVIEPAKEEYVQLALAYNQSHKYKRQIAVYVPGRTSWGGVALEQMKLNPFEIVRLPGAAVQVMPHLDRLKSIFNASFPMAEVLPVILEEALVDLYDSRGWLEEELPPEGVGYPTLEMLSERIVGLVRSKGYEQRITDNISAALKTRIGSLLRGWKGRLFNHERSTPWGDLFDRPVVINLQQMGDDADKCFMMALLLNFMYEYRQGQHESEGSPESGSLRHLAIIEEAHRVLRAAPPGQAGNANPQGKMGEMFADILAEIRAYGQGLAIIDQVPSKLVADALKNTNLKIIHRLVAADDREIMAGTLALTREQAEVIARLKVGQAIVSGVQDDMASWVKIFSTPMPRLKGAG